MQTRARGGGDLPYRDPVLTLGTTIQTVDELVDGAAGNESVPEFMVVNRGSQIIIMCYVYSTAVVCCSFSRRRWCRLLFV